MSDVAIHPSWRQRLSPRSFRGKFILVVGAAVLFDMLLGGGIALWNVQRLSRDAAEQVGAGLTKASREYLQTYVDATALRADLLLDRVHSEVGVLAGAMQAMIDHPDTAKAIGDVVAKDPKLTTPLAYDAAGDWSQNRPGAPGTTSVWSYLLDSSHQPTSAAQDRIRESAIFDILGPTLMETGSKKLQVYYVGPKNLPVMRATPASELAQTFDKLYPGHNKANFWDFFFPGIYEDWQTWLDNPSSRPLADDTTITAPYIDANSGKQIVSFFHPLWTADRKGVAGMAAADVTLDQLTDLVLSVKVADTGFGFLVMSNGNVIAVNPAGEDTLGVKTANDTGGQGVTGLDRSLRKSAQPAIAALGMPQDSKPVIERLFLKEGGEDVPYLAVLKQLDPTHLWNGSGAITKETMTLGFLVPEREIYASLIAAQADISAATNRILSYQIIAVLVSLIIVFIAIFGISKRITAGLSALATAARRLSDKDYSVRVDIPATDEVGQVGVAFNRMAEEIRYHTENLEGLVADRTHALGQANAEISALNEKLTSENLRLGAELDVARRLQLMVLPKAAELESNPILDIASFINPADEVAGDYYDVLQDGAKTKIGIGDVTGHGLESGVLMLMVQSVARALQESGENDPKKFLTVLNRAIYKNVERTATDKHLSLAFVDYEDYQLTLSGQHEEALIVRGDSEVERIDTIDLGFPVGLEPDIGDFVDTKRVPFNDGDLLILYTDGITEAENPSGEFFGLDRLCDSARRHRLGRADQVKDGIIADLMQYIGTQKLHDDITLVVLRHR